MNYFIYFTSIDVLFEKKEQKCNVRFKNSRQRTTASFSNGLKISGIDQLILAIIFRFGVTLVYKIGRKV